LASLSGSGAITGNFLSDSWDSWIMLLNFTTSPVLQKKLLIL